MEQNFDGDNIMGKKIKLTLSIVFLPITILFLLVKLIYRSIEKKILRKVISKISIIDIDGLDGHGFEEFLYLFFKSLNLNVKKTKSSRDYGADLIVEYKNKIIVIQCKLYYNHSVGNSAIQEINTAKNYYLADKGVVITNSYFTKSAISLSNSNDITLIDRLGMSSLLSSSRADVNNLLKLYFE